MNEASTDPTADELFGFHVDWSDSTTDTVAFEERPPAAKSSLANDAELRSQILQEVKRELSFSLFPERKASVPVFDPVEAKFEAILERKMSMLEAKLDAILTTKKCVHS